MDRLGSNDGLGAKIGSPALIDFSSPFGGQTEIYTFNESLPTQITRENFTSWMIQSFSVAEGTLGAHVLYIEWASAQTGQDIAELINLFLQAGGATSLTEEEKKSIKKLHDEAPTTRHKIHSTVQGACDSVNIQLKAIAGLLKLRRNGFLREDYPVVDYANTSRVDMIRIINEYKNKKKPIQQRAG